MQTYNETSTFVRYDDDILDSVQCIRSAFGNSLHSTMRQSELDAEYQTSFYGDFEPNKTLYHISISLSHANETLCKRFIF